MENITGTVMPGDASDQCKMIIIKIIDILRLVTSNDRDTVFQVPGKSWHAVTSSSSVFKWPGPGEPDSEPVPVRVLQ